MSRAPVTLLSDLHRRLSMIRFEGRSIQCRCWISLFDRHPVPPGGTLNLTHLRPVVRPEMTSPAVTALHLHPSRTRWNTRRAARAAWLLRIRSNITWSSSSPPVHERRDVFRPSPTFHSCVSVKSNGSLASATLPAV